MDTLIRKAGPGDAEQIADLSRKTFVETFAPFNTESDMEKFLHGPFTRANLIAEVLSPGSIFFLAEVGGKAAGYARLRLGRGKPEPGSDSIEIARLYADQSWLGKGIGHALMKACLDEAILLGKHTVWLGVWEHNTRAIRFYSNWGFEKFGETDFILGDDVQRDWLMKKDLS